MTLCRQKRLTTTHLAAYGQKRRRQQRPLLRRQGTSSSGGDRWIAPSTEASSPRSRSYLVGAFIYKKLPTTLNFSNSATGELALHVFDQYQIKVRKTEPESVMLQKIAQECSAGVKGKPTFTSSVYMVQKYVPVRYSSQCSIELNRRPYWSTPAVRYKVSLEFKRTYVSSFQHEYCPSGQECATYLSTVCFNIS